MNGNGENTERDLALGRIDAVTRNARNTWLGLLALLTYMSVTLLGVEPVDFWGYGRAVDLPLIGLGIPVLMFFIAAPVVTALIYAYFHFYLIRLWDALATAKPKYRMERTKDPVPLSELATPWLLTDAVLLTKDGGAVPERPLQKLAALVTIVMTWGFGWLVLGYAWWRSWASREEWLSLWILIWFLLVLWVGAVSLRAVGHRLGGNARLFRWAAQGRQLVKALGIAASVVLVLLTWFRTEGGIEYYRIMVSDYLASEDEEAEDRYQRHRAIENGMGSTRALSAFFSGERDMSILAEVELRGVELVPKPPGWVDFEEARTDFRHQWGTREGHDWFLCNPVPDLIQKSQREQWCAKQHPLAQDTCTSVVEDIQSRFTSEWDTRRTEYLSQLKKRDFSGKDLRAANLREAFGPGLNLVRARLENAGLNFARLENADLSFAHLENADLRGARLENASLSLARFENAGLSFARLENAKLSVARL